jgi:hypothetical protein
MNPVDSKTGAPHRRTGTAIMRCGADYVRISQGQPDNAFQRHLHITQDCHALVDHSKSKRSRGSL